VESDSSGKKGEGKEKKKNENRGTKGRILDLIENKKMTKKWTEGKEGG